MGQFSSPAAPTRMRKVSFGELHERCRCGELLWEIDVLTVACCSERVRQWVRCRGQQCRRARFQRRRRQQRPERFHECASAAEEEEIQAEELIPPLSQAIFSIAAVSRRYQLRLPLLCLPVRYWADLLLCRDTVSEMRLEIYIVLLLSVCINLFRCVIVFFISFDVLLTIWQ